MPISSSSRKASQKEKEASELEESFPPKAHHSPEGSLLPDSLKQELLCVDNPQEKEYRANILAAIERNVEKYGSYTAQPHDNRARQFMPFAALKGYTDMVLFYACELDNLRVRGFVVSAAEPVMKASSAI